jgi:putative ubiquitin-RnfH superfamily antitoxin RatB of RatAB toxin-antitoxin module
MAESGDIVEVVYATRDRQHVVMLPFACDLTAEAAVLQSGLIERCPEIATRSLVLGSFGKRIECGYRLRPGDRVEICRPLETDPRQMRRTLAARGAVMGESAEPKKAIDAPG